MASRVLNVKNEIQIKYKYICLGSSVVEHPAVNRQVVGSNPTLSAKNRLSGLIRNLFMKSIVLIKSKLFASIVYYR